jgi:hypothetical protein
LDSVGNALCGVPTGSAVKRNGTEAVPYSDSPCVEFPHTLKYIILPPNSAKPQPKLVGRPGRHRSGETPDLQAGGASPKIACSRQPAAEHQPSSHVPERLRGGRRITRGLSRFSRREKGLSPSETGSYLSAAPWHPLGLDMLALVEHHMVAGETAGPRKDASLIPRRNADENHHHATCRMGSRHDDPAAFAGTCRGTG